jgi:hypothetical protein
VRNISPYIQSLSENRQKDISEMLSDVYLNPTAPQLIDVAPYSQISSDAIGEMTEIGPLDISLPFTRVSEANSETWSAIESIERDLAALEGISTGMFEVLQKSLDRCNKTLLALGDMGVVGKTYDTLFIERFDNPSNTDTDYTTAVFSQGRLTIPYGRIWAYPAILSYVSSTVPMVNSSSVGDTLTIEGIGDPSVTRMNVVYNAALSGSRTVNTIKVTAQTGSIESVMALLSDGSTKVLQNQSVTPGSFITSTSDMSIVGLSITAKSDSGTPVTTSIGSPPMSDGSTSAATRAITSVVTGDQSGQPLETIVIPGANTPNNRMLFKTSISVDVSYIYHDEAAEWVSTPIAIEGDVKEFCIETTESMPAGCNSEWWASIAGSNWVPIHPRNKNTISSELLKFDGGGKAYFRFDAQPEQISISCEGKILTGEIWIRGSDNNKVIGICYLGDRSKPITVSYIPMNASSLDPTKYGISTGAGQLVDMTTGGIPGERLQADSAGIVLTHEPFIITEPSPNIMVFADGVKVDILSDDRSLSDPTLTKVSCKISGKTVKFSKTVGEVTVYYKYLKTSLRLKARIISIMADSGHLPEVDGVIYEVNHS